MNLSQISEQLANFGLSTTIQQNLVKSVVALLILWVLHAFVVPLILKNVKKRDAEYRWRKGIRYLIVFLAFIIVGRIWYSGVHSILTFLGLLSAGLAVALKDPIVNVVGWAYILWRQPFKVGQRIEIEGVVGDVIDTGLAEFSMLELSSATGGQSSGRIVHVPNYKIFLMPLANFDQSFAFIWHELSVVVTFESDWKKAKGLLLEIAKKHSHSYDEKDIRKFKKESKDFMLPELNLEPLVFTGVVDSGVKLAMRFVCEPRSRRVVEEAVWEEVLDTFVKESHIDLAYPTQRFFNNATEGKMPFKSD